MSNSIYGSVSDNRFFMFKREIGESITAVGRANLQNLEDYAKKTGITVIYGDTDAILVQLNGKAPKEVEHELNNEIFRFSKTVLNCDENKLAIKFEKRYARYLISKKKKYAGKFENGKIEIKGFECIRSDHSLFARKLQRDLIEDILNNGKITTNYPKSHLDILKVPLKELMIPKKLDKAISEYKGEPIHVRAVKSSRVPLSKGDTVYYLNMKSDQVVCCNFLSDEQLEKLRSNVNFKEIFENTIEHKIEILKELFPDTSQKTLFGDK